MKSICHNQLSFEQIQGNIPPDGDVKKVATNLENSKASLFDAARSIKQSNILIFVFATFFPLDFVSMASR